MKISMRFDWSVVCEVFESWHSGVTGDSEVTDVPGVPGVSRVTGVIKVTGVSEAKI